MTLSALWSWELKRGPASPGKQEKKEGSGLNGFGSCASATASPHLTDENSVRTDGFQCSPWAAGDPLSRCTGALAQRRKDFRWFCE
ncbi:unnamed protein product [Lota lota]